MTVIVDPANDGHKYLLRGNQILSFLKREKGELIEDGTTNEEVLEVLLDRLRFLQKKLPCRENACAITKVEEGLLWLNRRTEHRVKQGVETTDRPHTS